ncbi:unnamed protein product [Calicophoron daubneyi]|uniref:Uncharacterized protein n=1 Tax=Calicophoron daubneyi TaxID=300641 RepID=A0AAV2TRB0_CALDB
MSKLAGTWRFVSEEGMEDFSRKIGLSEEFIKEVADDKPTMVISFPDGDHVVFKIMLPNEVKEETCKYGVISEHTTPTGKAFKTIMTKESDTCLKSVQQDTAIPAQTTYNLCGNELHITSTAGDSKALTIFSRV